MSCCLTQQKYEERQKMVQLSMLLKLLKNMVIILAFDDYALDHIEDKVLPFSCVQRRKSTKGYTTHCNWAR